MSLYIITGEIYQVGGGSLTSPEDAAAYLINIIGHGTLVDAGGVRSTGMLIKNISAVMGPEQGRIPVDYPLSF